MTIEPGRGMLGPMKALADSVNLLAVAGIAFLFSIATVQASPATFSLSHVESQKVFGPFEYRNGEKVLIGKNNAAFEVEVDSAENTLYLKHVTSGKKLGPFEYRSGTRVKLGSYEFTLSRQEPTSGLANPPNGKPVPGGETLPRDTLAAAINKAAGMKIFADTNLWDDKDDAIASRLRLELEGRTSYDASFRRYPPAGTKIFGAEAFSIALYSENGQPTYLSIAFANKGDWYVAASGRAPENVSDPKELEELDGQFLDAIERDGDSIRESLREVLGKWKRGFFGRGELAEKVYEWEFEGHTFMLSEVEDSYLHLRLLPTSHAQGRGSIRRTSRDELKASCAKRVQTRENADVVITDIPMVDQGPKGYCVPATWERCLRYMSIQADMYILASKAGTERGGGTSSSKIAQVVERQADRHNRDLELLSENRVDFRALQRRIDDGLPMMWSMKVLPALNEELLRRSVERKRMSSLTDWQQRLKPIRQRAEGIDTSQGFGHVCMIIGYNPESEEIAFSDSWGKEFSERWMTYEEFEALSSGNVWYIDF